jgi:phosphoenolpyruvate carboxykinase (ATP)
MVSKDPRDRRSSRFCALTFDHDPEQASKEPPMVDLSYVGLSNTGAIYQNLSTPALYEEAIRREEGEVGHLGPFVVSTGKYTGRSADDKFVVEEAASRDQIWWGKVNKPFAPADFDKVVYGLRSYLQNKEVFIQDCYAGADPEYRIKVRVITEHAWHNLFARTMFIREFDPEVLASFEPDYTVIHCPDFQADPEQEHTRSEAFILLNVDRRMVVIGGTSYAGEIKKSIFTVMNYLLPQRGVLSLHSSANVGKETGDTAVFFGLSGTGKTTLSTEADRDLIGDDELGWSDQGVFNFEGGCYAKMIRLSDEAEPEIYQTTRRFGTVLENVSIDPDTRRLDLHQADTENTRGAYPITHLDNVVLDGMAGHPANIFMLTADAFGILPPIAKLTPEQAKYHFISGYTAKVAGTERGVKEPKATFSACFGAPFMPLHPTVYADLLGKKMAEHDVDVWLVNTGWTGGPYGVGERFKIAYSRAVIRAAISGALTEVTFVTDPIFGFQVPTECPGIPSELLNPRSTWDDPDAYDAKANELATLFAANFDDYAEAAGPDIAAAGPEVK